MSLYPKVRFLLSAASEEQFPADVGAEVAFAGRSNSGKSSAINTIMVRNGLARASKTPGRTRLLNFFEVEEGRRILDLPGYGYAEASPVEKKQWIALIARLPALTSISGLFLIVDIRRGITDQDEQLLDWAGAQAGPAFLAGMAVLRRVWNRLCRWHRRFHLAPPAAATAALPRRSNPHAGTGTPPHRQRHA
jgi:GTP-binding protein